MTRHRPGGLPFRRAVLLAAALASAPACGDGGGADAGRLLARAPEPLALVGLPAGGVLFGERATGIVRELGPDGTAREVARVEVGTEGQRGLLGLAVDGAGRVFAAWTDPGGTILVAQVAPGEERLVWRGPRSARRANGGHLELAPDGRLVIGVGDLEAPERVADPDAPNGKLLALDRDGPPGQVPEAVSGGWNNPFAFTYTPAGTLWVADNAPGEEPERLARVAADGTPAAVTELPGDQRAPSGLAAVGEDRLAVCAFVTGALTIHDVRDGRAEGDGRTLAGDCARGVARLASGELVYAADGSVRAVEVDRASGR